VSDYVMPRVGPKLFQFHTFDEWVNKARQWYGGCGYPTKMLVAIDDVGRMCRIGKHFMLARDEDVFPVRVHLKREDEETA